MFYLKKQLYSLEQLFEKKDRLITNELKNETKIKIQFNLVLFKDNI